LSFQAAWSRWAYGSALVRRNRRLSRFLWTSLGLAIRVRRSVSSLGDLSERHAICELPGAADVFADQQPHYSAGAFCKLFLQPLLELPGGLRRNLTTDLDVVKAFEDELSPKMKLFHCVRVFTVAMANYIVRSCTGKGA
jgi:hypothetical protein